MWILLLILIMLCGQENMAFRLWHFGVRRLNGLTFLTPLQSASGNTKFSAAHSSILSQRCSSTTKHHAEKSNHRPTGGKAILDTPLSLPSAAHLLNGLGKDDYTGDSVTPSFSSYF